MHVCMYTHTQESPMYLLNAKLYITFYMYLLIHQIYVAVVLTLALLIWHKLDLPERWATEHIVLNEKQTHSEHYHSLAWAPWTEYNGESKPKCTHALTCCFSHHHCIINMRSLLNIPLLWYSAQYKTAVLKPFCFKVFSSDYFNPVTRKQDPELWIRMLKTYFAIDARNIFCYGAKTLQNFMS